MKKIAKKTTATKIILMKEKNTLSRKNSDGTVAIMNLNNDQYFFTLDGIAAELWMRIDNKSTLEKISAELIKKYSPPLPKFHRDVTKLIQGLRKEKLISK